MSCSAPSRPTKCQIKNTAVSTVRSPSALRVLSSTEANATTGGSLSSDAANVDHQTQPPQHQQPLGDWSDSLQSLLDQPPSSLPLKLIMGAVLFMGITGAWSWFGTIEEVSFAQGHLEPLGDVYKLQSSVTGEVDEILVEEGEYVQRGRIIAATDRQLVEQDIQRLTQNLQADQAKLSQTQSLIQQTQAELNTLQTLTTAELEARQSNIHQERDAIDTNERILSQLWVNHQAQADRLERLAELVDRGALAEDQLFAIEQDLRDRTLTIIETQGNINESREVVTRLEAEMLQTQAIADKRLLEISQKLQGLQIEATDLASNIQETKILLEQSQAQLEQAIIVAPVSGVVSSLEVNNVGQVVQPGQTLAEIAPQKAPLVLSALLPSEEAGLVNTGMPVNIKFDAFPYQDYGIVTGEVLTISPDAKVDDNNGAVYQVKIALDTHQIEHEGEKITLRAGQTAIAEIVVRQRRIISLVLEPIRKLQKGNISL